MLHVYKWMLFPPWLIERMVIHYVFLRIEVWSKFDPAAWQHNEVLLGHSGIWPFGSEISTPSL